MQKERRSTRGTCGSGVVAQPAQHLSVGGHSVVPLRGLQNLGDTGQSGVGHDAAKWLGAEGAFGDKLVTVATRCKRCLGVIQVQTVKVVQAKDLVPTTPYAVVV